MSREIIHIESIAQAHQLLGLPKPTHPQVSVFTHKDIAFSKHNDNVWISMDLYLISLKGKVLGNLFYGRNSYDFQEGTIIFIGPNQVFSGSITAEESTEDWIILIDADLIRKSNLGKTIDNYQFFNYEINEALHLSENERNEISYLIHKIKNEYQQNIDKHTQDIILINLESLLKYCERYYQRQFITRHQYNKGVLVQFEKYLKAYFNTELQGKGLPTVKTCGEALNLSPYYLSDLLKIETGKSAKEHIDLFIVDKAKKSLLNSRESISEIAFGLGFKYPNHFSKLFKSKTGISPKEYRNLA